MITIYLDPNLKENLYDEFLKHGRISAIRIEGEGEKKICFVTFKHGEHAQAAVDNLNERLFLQTVLKVEKLDIYLCQPTTNGSVTTGAPNSSSSNKMQQQQQLLLQDEELDEYSLRATRTLYIGNLDRDVKPCDLREKLDKKYGDIIEIEIKKDNKKQQQQQQQQQQQPLSSSYAFIQFSDIKSVIKAMRCMHGKCIGNNLIKLGFGKSKPARVLWLDGISEQLKEAYLLNYFKNYCENNVQQVLIDRLKCQALVYFTTIEDAKLCADKIRAKRFYEKRVMVDFASKEFISSRFEHLLDPKHHLLINQQQLNRPSSGTGTPILSSSAQANDKNERKFSSRNNLFSSSSSLSKQGVLSLSPLNHRESASKSLSRSTSPSSPVRSNRSNQRVHSKNEKPPRDDQKMNELNEEPTENDLLKSHDLDETENKRLKSLKQTDMDEESTKQTKAVDSSLNETERDKDREGRSRKQRLVSPMSASSSPTRASLKLSPSQLKQEIHYLHLKETSPHLYVEASMPQSSTSITETVSSTSSTNEQFNLSSKNSRDSRPDHAVEGSHRHAATTNGHYSSHHHHQPYRHGSQIEHYRNSSVSSTSGNSHPNMQANYVSRRHHPDDENLLKQPRSTIDVESTGESASLNVPVSLASHMHESSDKPAKSSHRHSSVVYSDSLSQSRDASSSSKTGQHSRSRHYEHQLSQQHPHDDYRSKFIFILKRLRK